MKSENPYIADQRRCEDLAYQFADSGTRSDIESYCTPRQEDGTEPETLEQMALSWYDTTAVPDPEDAATIEGALEYLELRGMVHRHQDRPGWVRIKDEPTIARPA